MRSVDSYKEHPNRHTSRSIAIPKRLQLVTIVRGASELKVSINVGSGPAVGNSPWNFFYCRAVLQIYRTDNRPPTPQNEFV